MGTVRVGPCGVPGVPGSVWLQCARSGAAFPRLPSVWEHCGAVLIEGAGCWLYALSSVSISRQGPEEQPDQHSAARRLPWAPRAEASVSTWGVQGSLWGLGAAQHPQH